MTKSGWLRTTEGGVSVLAHRGGSGPWRENTLEAFAGARSMGTDGVELDARLTSDGEIVVHHNAKLEDGIRIASLRRHELPAWMPDIAGAVTACEGLLLDVEIKLDLPEPGHKVDDGACRSLTTGLAEVLARVTNVFVSSFWSHALVAFGEANSWIPTGLLVHPADDAEKAVQTASNFGCAALLPFHSVVTPELVDKCHEMGLQVGTWTANGREQVRAMVEAGVDAVITDEVDSALSVARIGPHPSKSGTIRS